MKQAIRRRWLTAALALAALCALVPAAHAATEAQALAAAQQGATWLASQQDVDGSLGGFGGDWSLTALAAAGVNAADVRTSALDPSAQDHYLSLWTSFGPGGQATDYERGILAAHAAGLQPAGLDGATNFVAALAAQFDGTQLGGAGATNANIFGLLALQATGAPPVVQHAIAQTLRAQQGADGGWSFSYPAGSSDVDVTGAGIAALCGSGATAQDPDVVQALDFVRSHQDAASGGFVAQFTGLNTDTTSWVLSGLRACGIDPQTWTTAQGKSPLDFLIGQQNPDGSFQWQLGDFDENLYATQDATRALAGVAFTAAPPARADGHSPAVRPAPSVPAGTLAPMTLVIDSGGHVTGGSAVRMCQVSAPVGGTVADLLQAALASSAPAWCLSDLWLDGGRVGRVNGVAATPGASSWAIRRDGGPAEQGTAGTLGLGSLVQLTLAPGNVPGTPSPGDAPPPPHVRRPRPVIPPPAVPARLRLHTALRTHVTDGRVRIALACPRGVGAGGCDSVVHLRLWSGPRRLRLRDVGSAAVHVAAGETRRVAIALSPRGKRIVRARRAPVATLLAATRDPRTGAVTLARAKTVLR